MREEPESDAERLCRMAEALETIEATKAAILDAFRSFGFPPEGARFPEFLGFLRTEGPGYAEWALDTVRGTPRPAAEAQEDVGLRGLPDEPEGEATEAPEEDDDLGAGDLVLITKGPWSQITGRVEAKIIGKDAFRIHIKLQSKETSVTIPRKHLGLLEKAPKSTPTPPAVPVTEFQFSNPMTLREAIMCVFMTKDNAPITKKEVADGVKQILPKAVDEKTQATFMTMCNAREILPKADWPAVLPPAFVLENHLAARLLAATQAKQDKLFEAPFDKDSKLREALFDKV